MSDIKNLIENYKELSSKIFLDTSIIEPEYFNNLKKIFPNQKLYKLWVVICQDVNFSNVSRQEIENSDFEIKSTSELKRLQQKETIKRYQLINNILKEGQIIDSSKAQGFRAKIDKILTHKIFGYLIFLMVLMVIFQSIYEWASVPMDLIDSSFASLSRLG